jgi:hypothetical protein
MTLVWPSMEYLPGYVAALEQGWSPDNVRGEATTQEHLERIAGDPEAFVASLASRSPLRRTTFLRGMSSKRMAASLSKKFSRPAALGGGPEVRYRVNLGRSG